VSEGQLPDLEENGGVPELMREIAIEEDTYEKLLAELNGKGDDFSKVIDRLIDAFHDPSKNPYLRIEGRE